MIRWTLTGTDAQQAIAREAFNRIKFPFDRLSQLPGTPELGWRDLNSGALAIAAFEKARNHGGAHGEDKPDSLEGELDGRRWVMGVIYTQSGRIYIDTRLEAQPEKAMAVIGAEIAHAVDFFLPMADAQRNELLRLWGKPGTTWWEVLDYAEEYFRIGGEAWMHEWLAAYSDLQFGDKSAFAHDVGVDPPDVRRILGIERTDYVTPVKPHAHFVRYGKSLVFQEPAHKIRSKYPAEPLHDLKGLRPCKTCKPGDTP